jgi:UDPglucose 6-dehydrogenase
VNLSIVGAGYVGLVTGACLADKGHRVTCVDLDLAKVDAINAAASPIHEEGLAELIARNVPANLTATTDLTAAVMSTDITLIAVGTPFDGRHIDLDALERVAAAIGDILREKHAYHAVVVKSTVVPGTTEELVAAMIERRSGKTLGTSFGVGMNPEFLREGQAVADFMSPDRIVLGAEDPEVLRRCSELYAVFPDAAVVHTTTRTAEMMKYASNALLAMLISFSNDLANLCAVVGGVDACEVMAGVKLDRRLSPLLEDGTRVTPGVLEYLDPGCGFGGSCFPKDVQALTAFARTKGSPLRILEQVLAVNEEQPQKMVDLLRRRFDTLAGLRVAVLGLAFKPDTDDLRSSPAIPVVQSLRTAGADVIVYDPVVRTQDLTALGWADVGHGASLERAVTGVDAVLLVTSWAEFGALPALVAGLDRPPVIVDGRRMLPADSVPLYEGIGR